MNLPGLHGQEIELKAGALVARVRPDVGGSVSGFWRTDNDGAVEVLRAAGPHAAHPLEMASFPLAPWCNRIKNGDFKWKGRAVHLSPTDSRDQYPLHGYGWKARWEETSRSADRVEMRWRYAPGEWPWAFEAQQTISLRANALLVDLRLTNLAPDPAPAGLGHHPYYPLRETTRLLTNVSHKCETNAALIPIHLAPVDGGQVFGENRRPHGHVIDNSFVGWREPAYVEQPDVNLRVRITAEPPQLHPVLAVFVPPSQEFFCVEPVHNAPNALNQPELGAPMHVVQPGETLRSMMVLEVRELSD